MKQYVVFLEDSILGQVIEESQLYEFIDASGYVYEIGPIVGKLQDLAEKSLIERDKEE